ncbi:MAG: M14 family zinc carboxypeptidase [Pseudomonadota bacterium]
MRLMLIAALFALLTPPAVADDLELWPGAVYDTAIPTVETVLGHAPGERITTHADTRRYFEALAAAAPDRIKVVPYAKSWEGRELFYAVVTAAENLSQLDAIKAGMQALRDPRKTSAAEAARIIENQKPVTWLSYAVHGNEISTTDSAIYTAYHLLAATNDPRVPAIMNDTVVVIDPLQNPDGRDRFILRFNMARGLVPDSDRISAEHNEPWPSGRTNHYLFDMNRDWFVQTQPETRGRIKAIAEFYPVAFVDSHEMGSDQTYYFAPEAEPYNPHLAADQRASLELFGRTNAKWFDQFGIDYFTREVYDAFYPGYGASWPSYFGSVAMTYEQASARGLVVRKYDGVEMTYLETVRNQFVTSMGTAETTAVHAKKLLEDFYDYQVTAIEEGRRGGPRSYLIPTQADQAGADKLAGLLAGQGVDVQRADSAFSVCGNRYAAGSYAIDLAQPAKRLIRTLLDADVPLPEDFAAEQQRRRAKGLRDQIYDVTAWSLPLMMNVTVDACNRAPSGSFTAAGPELVQSASVSGPSDAVAYLVPWGQRPAARLLGNAYRAGLAVKSTDKAFTHAGREYPAGTLIFDAADNPGTLRGTLSALATTTGAEVVGVASTWVTAGPNFGSNNVVRMNAPRVAIAWDEPTSQYSAGNTRFVIERQFDYPVTAIRTSDLAGADLRRYQVLILPESRRGYRSALDADHIAEWVDRGGVLITLGDATRWVADPEVDLLAIRREDRVVDEAVTESVPEEDKDDPETTVPGTIIESDEDFKTLTTPDEDNLDSVGGVLLRAVVDGDHWLGAGVAETLNVLVRGSDVYTPIRLDEGVNVARFAPADEVLASGFFWEENRLQYAYKPFVVVQEHGDGYVVAFTQDPTVRAYLDGLNVILMNAIFRGAAHARPVR